MTDLLFSEIALSVCKQEGIDLRLNSLDTTGFSLTGEYEPGSEEHTIVPIVPDRHMRNKQAHMNAFRYFGRVTTILYDNMKTVVLSREGDKIQWNPQFLEFASFYGVTEEGDTLFAIDKHSY